MQKASPFLNTYLNNKLDYPNGMDCAWIYAQQFKPSMLPELFKGFSQWEGRNIYEYKHIATDGTEWDCFFTFTQQKMIINRKNNSKIIN